MIKKLFYIFIVLLIILIILNKYKYFKLNYKENFQSSCNNFFKGNTFCQLNKNCFSGKSITNIIKNSKKK